QQRQEQHLTAAHTITEQSDDHAADRPGEEAHGEGAQRGESPGELVARREEHVGEYEGRCRPVEREVIPLQGGPDRRGEGGAREARRSRHRLPSEGVPSTLNQSTVRTEALDVKSR